MKATIRMINKDRFPNTRVVAAWCNYPGGTTGGTCPSTQSWPCENCDHCMVTISDGFNNPVVKTDWEITQKRWRYFVNKGKVYGIGY